MKKSIVIGSGFAGLASASLIAKAGHQVQLLEKNTEIGGRARQFSQDGFTFDMGPSWYWMPDVFERYFKEFGKHPSDFFHLKKLDPAFRIFFSNDTIDVSGEPHGVYELFERLEPGRAKKLGKFFKEAEFKYRVGVHDIIYRQPDGIKPFMDWKVIKAASRLHLLKSMRSHIDSYFSHPYLRQILEFPVLFLGADPMNTPALYSMMDYAGLILGTWYPMGGFSKVIQAMETVARNVGVEICTEREVESMDVHSTRAQAVLTNQEPLKADAFVVAGDYHHFDQKVIPESHRQYSEKYWDTRKMAPSSLLYYIGHKGKVKDLEHHNLFFDTDFDAHSDAIYKTESLPEDPLFYVCCPSKTDSSVAPEGDENLFILVPIAAGLEDPDDVKEAYFNMVCDRIKKRTGVDIRDNLVVRRDYAMSDFKRDYHAFKGNAYGLANTLKQTAFLKPTMKHKKLSNVFMSGQLTVPGPGVPPSLISGQLAANYVIDYLNKNDK